ncbi:MAG: LTA synthase family protein [Fluviicola sp.]
MRIRFLEKMPSTLKSLLLRLTYVIVALTLTRALFLFSNYDSFLNITFSDWFTGVWFDLVTVCLIFLPFIILSFCPFSWQKNRFFRFIQALCFHLPFFAMIALNLLDTEYFSFTQKRSTIDLFTIVGAGNDIAQLLGSFLRDFWFVILIFIVFLFLNIRFYKKTSVVSVKSPVIGSWKQQLLIFVIGLPLVVITGRGGLKIHKPLSPIDATLFTDPQNTAFVLNSAFTILKSYGKADLEQKKYFSDKKLKRLFNPIRTTNPQHLFKEKPNVFIIMLESFGNEWVGKFNGGNSYTPFLDSLLDESWTFEYGISNGKKSIEGVPSIVSSMPSLMDNPYISSPYCNNNIESLAQIFNENGYYTGFYHGATNGSMRFNSFAKQVGFQDYIGRFEYNNDKHFDKTWGILDEYFNPWTVRQLSKKKAPFFATLFTLSSHHPYYVPKEWRKKVKNGPNPICKSISYGDISLRKLFDQAKKEKWFENTIFVFVADHTSATNDPLYSLRTQCYKIPIAFYTPGKQIPAKFEKTIFQHNDIMPTILDLADIKTSYYSFGNSYFSKNPREGLAYLEGTYYYYYKNFMLEFSQDKPGKLIDFTKKTLTLTDVSAQNKAIKAKMVNRLKAIIQTYSRDLTENKTTVKQKD